MYTKTPYCWIYKSLRVVKKKRVVRRACYRHQTQRGHLLVMVTEESTHNHLRPLPLSTKVILWNTIQHMFPGIQSLTRWLKNCSYLQILWNSLQTDHPNILAPVSTTWTQYTIFLLYICIFFLTMLQHTFTSHFIRNPCTFIRLSNQPILWQQHNG